MTLEKLQNGRYQLTRLIGKGGMGEVYLMRDERVNRQVAIKVIRSESTPYPEAETAVNAARLFQREAKAIAALDHPNILPLYDFGEEVSEDSTLSYMVMPFCAEGSLASWLRMKETSILAPRDVVYFVNQAADALQYAHDNGVIHLDVKPPNFLLRTNKKNPDRPTILLADFGVARSSATVSSSSRTIRGTPVAMAPEQWSGGPVAATDQYALAVMAYEMLTGRPPFIGSMEQLMYKHFTVAPPAPSSFNPNLPASLDRVLLRALAKKPEERYPSVNAFADAFEQAVMGTSTHLSDQSVPSLSDSESQVSKEVETATVIAGTEQDEPKTPVSVGDRQELIPTQLVASSPSINRSVEHDLPTVASSSWSPVDSSQAQKPKTSSLQRLGVIGIAVVLVLVLGLSGVFYFTHYSPQKLTQASITTGNTATRAATAYYTPTPTVGITPTPTQVPNGMYIPGTYNGSMQDNTTSQTSTITVYLTQKKGSGALNGSVTFKSPNQEVYPLSGVVDMQGNFSFTAQTSGNQKPLYFYGAVQTLSDGNYLKGEYCTSTTSSCIATTGIFDVGPGY